MGSVSPAMRVRRVRQVGRVQQILRQQCMAARQSMAKISSVPTLFEQIQLISQICRNFVLDGSRKQLIQRDSLEHRQAQDL